MSFKVIVLCNLEYGNVSYRDLKARQKRLEEKDTEGSWLGSDGDELVESKTGMELSNNLPSPLNYK